ncbi:carbamoyl-phosphate synthase, small subunit [Streptococcus pneumoniae]|nr:carbamoyl-phosphate synthase, small subunit [Streptococcus pneumoniae]
MTKRILVLEDGTVFEGKAFGADIDVTGEIVFILHPNPPIYKREIHDCRSVFLLVVGSYNLHKIVSK